MKLLKIDWKVRRSHARKESNTPATERRDVGSLLSLLDIINHPAKGILGKAGLLDDLIRKKLDTFEKLFVRVMVRKDFQKGLLG